MKKELLNQLKEIGIEFDLDLLILFGSRATNTNSQNSDLDIAYISNKKINELDLISEITKKTNINDIDLIEIDERINPVILNWEIFKTGILIYEKEKNLFYELLGRSFINYIDFKENLEIENEILNKQLDLIDTSNFRKKIIL